MAEKKTKATKTVQQEPAVEQEETVLNAEELAEQLKAAQEQIETLQNELAAANDKYLRMIAEYDNFRKRSAHDRELACAEATEKALKNILPIGDNLARASVFTDPESVKKGMAMILKGFDEALKKMGITEIDVKEGDAFDPELHNAVMHVEDESYGESVVVEILQKGYQYGDRVIRYAMVKVAN